MKIIILLSLLISLSSFAKDENCIAITKDQLCIQLEWTEGPFLGAYSKNTVRFKDLKHSTPEKTVYRAPKESIQFFGWMVMANHEHGTRPVTTSILESGVYENTKIFYMGGMMGSWHFKLKLGTEEFILHVLEI